MSHKTITLDVREDIRNGREPFSKIMSAATALQADERLLLIAPFEPVPLFAVLGKQGFHHNARPVESGDWEVVFTRGDQHTSPLRGSRGEEAATEIVEVDARGLEPPQPMVSILETLASLPAGAELHARTDRRPMHLYAHLEERGFTAETQEQPDGSFLTQIRRG